MSARYGSLCVSDTNQRDEVARLERLNEDLGESLRRCRKLLHDYEVRLAANSNDEASPQGEEQPRKA
jgi:hypothetical protein